MIHGYPAFFQAQNPDVVLRVIYSIGYMNLFASGYFLLLLLRHRPLYPDHRPAVTGQLAPHAKHAGEHAVASHDLWNVIECAAME